MGLNMECIVCGNCVEQDIINEDFDHLFNQADSLGMDSLTEAEQSAVSGYVCSYSCFESLE